MLTAEHVSAAVEALNRVSDLNFPIDPLVLGKLRADAFAAASDLRIFGLRDVKIEVKENAIYVTEEEDQDELAEKNLESAKELLAEQSDLLEKLLQVCSLSVDALLSSKEEHLRILGKAFGEEMHDVIQYGCHLESDHRFQQFYRQESES